MTLNITGIAADEPDERQPARNTNPVDQFWTAAGDVLIEVVNRQPGIRTIVEGVINAGGDIEITAHNQAGRISVTLAGPSGLRHIVLADARQMLL
ncbi:MAG: hypothetical protein ABWZ94_00185 [Methyloceanibacter sp.]|jgi:hypothetical protein